jgi:hypothetical protein
MFEPLKKESWLTPSIKSFIAQQSLAFWAPLLFAVVVAKIMGDQSSGDDNSGNIWPWYVFFCACGCVLAYLVSHLFPNRGRDGRWVWVLPTCWFVLAFATELPLKRTTHSLLETLRKFFHPTRNDFFLAIAFATLPMLACWCYALVMFVVADRMSRGIRS